MAKAHAPTDTLTIDLRQHAGTTAARAVRRAGKIPGVLYGHGEPTAIAVGSKALDELLTQGGKSHILDATIGGAHDSVLLRDVQRDPISRRPIHADFQRVSKGEAIYASIAVAVTGSSPAVRDGAILDIVTRTVDVKGPADKLPDSITLDVSALGVHSHITAADLELPPGFTLVTAPEQVIVSVEASRTAAAVAADEAAAPTPVAEAPAAEAPVQS